MTDGNYKFMQNLKCECFPCHSGADASDFNCIFCFCPLYYTDDCGGNCTYSCDGVKDCHNCLIPHKKENYDMIIEKINEYNKKRGDAGERI